MYFGWLKEVRIHDLVDVQSEGVFQGTPYKGAELTSIELQNHGPPEFTSLVDDQVAASRERGVVVEWVRVADVVHHPKPHMVTRLGVTV